MEIFLLDSEFKTERYLPNYTSVNIGKIILPINDVRANYLLDYFKFGSTKIKDTFSIVVKSPSSYPPISDLYVRFNKCVFCGYGRFNGVENFSINFWEHCSLSLEDKRNFLINQVINEC